MVDVQSIANTVTGLAMTLIAGAAIIALVGGVLYVLLKMKRYDYTVVIFEKDGFNQPIKSSDMGGIFVDSLTKNKLFYLKKNNVGMKPDNIPYIQDTKGHRIVFLKRLGLKNFAFISFREMFDEESKIIVGEEDVNWAVNAYDRQKATFGTSTFERVLPFLGLIIMGVLIIGMVYLVFQKIPLLVELTAQMKETAEILAGRSATTIVTQGGG